MSKVIEVDKIENTRLWKQLNKQNNQLAQGLLGVCNEAMDRMKAMPTYMPQYTLHDETHLLRTTELMAHVLGETKLKLNTVELALLILSAFFHDQGMVPTAEEYSELQKDPDFQLFKDNWLVEFSNYRQIETQLKSQVISDEERKRLALRFAELNNAMLTEYLRRSHAQKSADYLNSEYGSDRRLEIYGINLAPFGASLCKSHGMAIDDIHGDSGFRFDEQIGTDSVNMAYLAAILRLADILDFDRDRTPESLFKSIHFTSEVSLIEWEKHSSVQGWEISEDRIRFTMRSKHPIYEATARKFMDLINIELSGCHELCRKQPKDFEDYKLELPTQVDKSRIGPKNNLYRYHDLEFRLSRDDVVRLFMTDNLYGSPHLCIRELLQNSLDAIRYRKSLFESAGNTWDDGQVKFNHSVDDNGYEIIECSDNGSGMDENIVINYFVKVGRSYYRSPEFERERVKLQAKGLDFDPCSKFGIGFMSCFMLGDRITVETRKDYGPGKEYGKPLIVEMHGLGGLIVIRDGKASQPVGTRVTIFSRKKPAYTDTWTDQVKLIGVMKHYALATEFPIYAKCEIPEILDEVSIPPEPDQIPTCFEEANVVKKITLEQDLGEIDGDLQGCARESFLIDESGLPCLANAEAEWVISGRGSSKSWSPQLIKEKCDINFSGPYRYVPICVDGILVVGEPGRASFRNQTRMLGSRGSHICSQSPVLVDARGNIKPELTPKRIPPDNFGSNLPPRWRYLTDKIREGLGQMWEKLAGYLDEGLSEEDFWKLTSVYDRRVADMRVQCLWERLPVSLVKEDAVCCWKKICDLGQLSFVPSKKDSFGLIDSNGYRVEPPHSLKECDVNHCDSHWSMNMVTLLMCSVDVFDDNVTLFPNAPQNPEDVLSQYIDSSDMGANMFYLNYSGTAAKALAIETPYPSANSKHPLSVLKRNSRYKSEESDLEIFASGFVPCVSKLLSPWRKDKPHESSGRWQKIIAHRYFEVDWSKYDDSFKPPYKIWTSEKGWTEITENDLVNWRDSSDESNE